MTEFEKNVSDWLCDKIPSPTDKDVEGIEKIYLELKTMRENLIKFITTPKMLADLFWLNGRPILFWIYSTTKGTIYLN